MPEREWKWYAGYPDVENYQVGPYNSRQEAIDAAIMSGQMQEVEPDDEHKEWRIRVAVVEACKCAIDDLRIDEGSFLSDLEITNEELLDPDGDMPLIDADDKDLVVLRTKLKEALISWVEECDVKLHFFMFSDTRNEETLTLPWQAPKPD